MVKKGITEIDEGVWCIAAPLNGISVCIYVLRGDRLAIIDTGYSFHPETTIVPALREVGFEAQDVDLIVNTHGHPDHLGGNAALKKGTGARTCLHYADLNLAGGAEAHINSGTDDVIAMRELGWLDEVEARSEFLHSRVPPCEIDWRLCGADVIPIGRGLDLSVVETPGHTPGSITLYAEKRGLAFSGDAVQCWGTAKGVLPLYYAPRAYRMSLDALSELKIVRLCLGHDFVWSKSKPGGEQCGAVRKGSDVAVCLHESKQFAQMLCDLAASPDLPEALPEAVRAIAGSLPPPHSLECSAEGRFSASSAATILSQIRETRGIPSGLAGRDLREPGRC